MSFKNQRGEVPWYVIALILAIIVLVVSLFAIPKIRDAQGQSTNPLQDTCTIIGGTCVAGDTCTVGSKATATCPDEPAGTKRICCRES